MTRRASKIYHGHTFLDSTADDFADNLTSFFLMRANRRLLTRILLACGTFGLLVAWLQSLRPLNHGRHTIEPASALFGDGNDAGFRESVDELGFLAADVAESFCAVHSWAPYQPRNRRRKIYDLVMMNTELDWLEIRLHELSAHVDYFVIVEAPLSFSGQPKPLVLQEQLAAEDAAAAAAAAGHNDKGRFSAFRSRIIHHVLNDTAVRHSTNSWTHEDLQRNAMLEQVFPTLSRHGDGKGDDEEGQKRAPALGDVIVVGDVDELPRPAALAVLRNCRFPRRLTLRSRFFYYGFQWLHAGTQWAHPQATYYEGEGRTLRPADLRNGETPLLPWGWGWGSSSSSSSSSTSSPSVRSWAWWERADLWNAGWHCSSCFGTVAETVDKIGSFSHTKLNQEAFRDPRWIVGRVRRGLDLFNRSGEHFGRVAETGADLPAFLREEAAAKRFAYLLDRDPVNANFADVSVDEATGWAEEG